MRRFLPLFASVAVLALPSAAQAYTFYEWSSAGGPTGIAQAGTGPLTVAFQASAAVGQIGLGGVQSAPVSIAGGSSGPTKLAAGPGDGNLWFVDGANRHVGRTDPGTGPVLLLLDFAGTTADLVASNNNLMWVVESDTGELDCITPAGIVTPKTSGLAHPQAIARANDGALWYVDSTSDKIARLVPPATCAGTITPAIFDTPAGFAPTDITAAPAGNDVFVSGSTGLRTVTPAGGAPPPATRPHPPRRPPP